MATPLRVLVVDDSEDFRQNIAEVLGASVQHFLALMTTALREGGQPEADSWR